MYELHACIRYTMFQQYIMPVARHFDTKHGCAGVLLEKRRQVNQLQRFLIESMSSTR